MIQLEGVTKRFEGKRSVTALMIYDQFG